jgi:hypothetical protein
MAGAALNAATPMLVASNSRREIAVIPACNFCFSLGMAITPVSG